MAGGFKRGGFRGGGGGIKKGYSKKRSPEEDENELHTNKKSKRDDEEDDSVAPVIPKLQTDDDNNPFVAINHSGRRRVTVSDFKGTLLISIREHWTNDAGELKPGKKGISLSVEQYNALLAAAPLLESVLKGKDTQVTRPNYEADLESTEATEKEERGGQQLITEVDHDNDEE